MSLQAESATLAETAVGSVIDLTELTLKGIMPGLVTSDFSAPQWQYSKKIFKKEMKDAIITQLHVVA